MAASASTLNHLHRPLPATGASPLREIPDELGKYRFEVVAANIADAVTSIGGLIFDRAMAGWEVSVLIDGEADRIADDRPIRILGARMATMSDPSFNRLLPRPNMLAVATEVMLESDAVRRHVLAIGSDTEVLLWGRHHPTNLGRTFVVARHQPSAAAQVFKSHALSAGGVQATGRADEGLYAMV